METIPHSDPTITKFTLKRGAGVTWWKMIALVVNSNRVGQAENKIIKHQHHLLWTLLP